MGKAFNKLSFEIGDIFFIRDEDEIEDETEHGELLKVTGLFLVFDSPIMLLIENLHLLAGV
jgi:hypothetical protein